MKSANGKAGPDPRRLTGAAERRHVGRAGIKAGDIDPRGEREYCYLISDKTRAIAGGVLEAILHSLKNLPYKG